jgi:hypothetical protein
MEYALKNKNFVKIIFLVSFLAEGGRCLERRKIVFLLQHNLEVECLLNIIYGFPVVSRDYKICNTAGKS